MQVIAARYNKADQVLLLVDQIPGLESLRYRKVRVDDILDRGYLYVAEYDGYVHATFQTDSDNPGLGRATTPRSPYACSWDDRDTREFGTPKGR
jgi:hypothetical protein